MTEKYIAGYAKRLKEIETNLAADENYCVVAQEKLEQLISASSKFECTIKTIYTIEKNLYDKEKNIIKQIVNYANNQTLVSDYYEQVELFSGLAGTLPDLKANKRAAEIERLFYSAAFAADSAAGNNFNLRMAQAEKKEVENEIRNNPYLHILDEMKNHAFYCHDMLTQEAEKKASFPAYHLQASLKMQVTTFTMASLLMTIYGADNSTDFIKHMLRNARNAAVRNINECVKADIPCIAAICDFETAESSDTANDTFTALMSYWRASLYAKALLMSFK